MPAISLPEPPLIFLKDMDTKHIQIIDFNYPLPDERIAKYPLPQRDASKLLVYRKGEIIVDKSRLAEASLYPRVIYKQNTSSSSSTDDLNLNEGDIVDNLYNLVSSAEGIWIDVAGNNQSNPQRSDFFDFYIRTCWQSAGTRVPSTLTTVVRLYNPEVMQ